MSKTLKLATDGDWKAHGADVITSTFTLIATAGTKNYPDLEKRAAERSANARLFAASKRMYQVILDLQFKPMSEIAIEIKEVMQAVEGEPLNEDFTYEHP